MGRGHNKHLHFILLFSCLQVLFRPKPFFPRFYERADRFSCTVLHFFALCHQKRSGFLFDLSDISCRYLVEKAENRLFSSVKSWWKTLWTMWITFCKVQFSLYFMLTYMIYGSDIYAPNLSFLFYIHHFFLLFIFQFILVFIFYQNKQRKYGHFCTFSCIFHKLYPLYFFV